MNRRAFSKTLASAALCAPALTGRPAALSARDAAANSGPMESPFKISIMIWTVFHGLPFEQRLEKDAEAGYHSVELVNETSNWTEDDFRRYNKKRVELGITFDASCAVRHGV